MKDKKYQKGDVVKFEKRGIQLYGTIINHNDYDGEDTHYRIYRIENGIANYWAPEADIKDKYIKEDPDIAKKYTDNYKVNLVYDRQDTFIKCKDYFHDKSPEY